MQQLQPPHIPETSPGDTWTQYSVANFLIFNPSQYWSNHQKQDLLIIASKSSISLWFQIPCSHDLSTLTVHFQSTFAISYFYYLQKIGESYHPWGCATKSWTQLTSSFPWITSETKRYKYWIWPAFPILE